VIRLHDTIIRVPMLMAVQRSKHRI